MKKFLLLLVLCLGVSISNAQNDGFYLDDGVVLNGDQWHYDNLSIFDAGATGYLVVTPYEYYYAYLGPFNYAMMSSIVRDEPLSYRPYVRKDHFGWLIQGRHGVYFAYQIGSRWYHTQLYSAPIYYNYYYDLYNVRYVNMAGWHFAPPPGPRTHHNHHHYGTPSPSQRRGYVPGNQRTPPPQNPNQGGYTPGNRRTTGTTVRPSNPPSRDNRGGAVRTSGRSSGSSRSGGYSSGSNRSSGRASGGSSTRSSGGGSNRRR